MESRAQLSTKVAWVLKVIVIAVYMLEDYFFSRMVIITQTALVMLHDVIDQDHCVKLKLGILSTLYFTLNVKRSYTIIILVQRFVNSSNMHAHSMIGWIFFSTIRACVDKVHVLTVNMLVYHISNLIAVIALCTCKTSRR